MSVITIGSYRVFGKSPESQRLNRRRVYARSTAKILENIRDCILGVREADATGSQSAILRIIVDRTRDMVGGADAGSISANLMVRQGPSALKTIAVDQPTKGRGKSEISLDSPGAGHALRSGEAVYIDDVKELGKAFREDAPYRSILSIPIRSGDDLIGAVSIDSTEPRHFYAGIHDHLDPYVQLLGLLLCIPARGTA